MLRKLISAVTVFLIVCAALWFAFELGNSGKFGEITKRIINSDSVKKNKVNVNLYERKPLNKDSPAFAAEIGDGEEAVIREWFVRYYNVLGTLSGENTDDVKAFLKLYHPKSTALESDALVLNRLVASRKQCSLPLTFPVCDAGLRLLSAVYADSELVEIRIEECFAAIFDGFPGTLSTYAGIEHFFTLEKSGENWLVKRHETSSAYANYAAARVTEPEFYRYPAGKVRTAPYPYDRKNAAEYALTYTSREDKLRNFSYNDYPDNSANFVSQCVKAGGIPVDSRWNKNNAAFRDGDAFYEYATEKKTENNKKTGLIAGICDFKDAETGDIIQFIDSDGHVINSAVIVGSYGGEPLIASNSDDTANFPAAAAGFEIARVLKIYGYC